jgi:hypothetical protein
MIGGSSSGGEAKQPTPTDSELDRQKRVVELQGEETKVAHLEAEVEKLRD